MKNQDIYKREHRLLDANGFVIDVVEDIGSDRIRCDQQLFESPERVASQLIDKAKECERGRVVALVDERIQHHFAERGYKTEATIPGFYAGASDCAVMGYYLDESRQTFAYPKEVQQTYSVLEQKDLPTSVALPDTEAEIRTRQATLSDAEDIAHLLNKTFETYPTPSHKPAYIRKMIDAGHIFRVVEQNDVLVACASADLSPEAQTAELTDCATKPRYRGLGFMRALLIDLMHDLKKMDYPTAFTLARARIPGINIAFAQLGFELRGCMPQSCDIGGTIEDMNVWSRAL